MDVERTLIPRLDAKEVAAVFSGPFHNFLRIREEGDGGGVEPAATSKAKRKRTAVTETEWYQGSWSDWHESRWRMHNFFVPIAGQVVARSRPRTSREAPLDAAAAPAAATYPREAAGASPLPYAAQPDADADPLAGLSRFRVFGMTARILVDAARVAYAEEPEFEHNSHFGDEGLIEKLIRVGKMGRERSRGEEFVGGDVKELVKRDRRRGRGRL